MCRGVIYTQGGQKKTIFFRHTSAALPVQQRSGETLLLPWGRRRHEPGILPMGANVSLDAIKQGHWDEYQIKAIKLPVLSFQEEDIEGQLHWFVLTAGQWIQGLLAKLGNEQRVYVVTLTPQRHDKLYERWPRIMNNF